MTWTAKTGAALALAVCGVSALLVWLLMPAPVQPIEQAQPLPSLIDPTDTVPDTGPAPIRSAPKTKKTAKVTKLPDAVIQSPDSHILAVSKLDADERDYTLSAVLDRPSGITTIHATPEPLPWLALESKGAVGIAYGVADSEQSTALYWRHSLLRSKNFHAGGFAYADTAGQTFIGGSVEWRY